MRICTTVTPLVFSFGVHEESIVPKFVVDFFTTLFFFFGCVLSGGQGDRAGEGNRAREPARSEDAHRGVLPPRQQPEAGACTATCCAVALSKRQDTPAEVM